MKNLRTLLYMLTLLLSVVGIQPAEAQESAVQDALYIYRNDGGFHGFFYDEIERFDYSRIDTLGVEHEDYVVQEVVTGDSIYRIPLSAIDSIGFVTPETVYKKDVAHTTKSDMWNYVISSDSLQFVLAANTPIAMIPKVGDKLITTKCSDVLPTGFIGKVTSISNDALATTVTCDFIDPEEIYDQHVIKVRTISEDEALSRGVWTRSSGEESTITVKDIDFDFTIDCLSSGMVSQLGVVLISGKVAKVRIHGVLKIWTRAFCAIHYTGRYKDITQRMELDANILPTINSSITLRGDVPFPMPPIPLGETGLILKPAVGLTLSLTGSINKSYKYHSNCVLEKNIQDNFILSFIPHNNSVSDLHIKKWISNIECQKLSGSGTASVGGFGSLSLLAGPFTIMSIRQELGAKATLSAEFNEDDCKDLFSPKVMPESTLEFMERTHRTLSHEFCVSIQPYASIKMLLGAGVGSFGTYGMSELSFDLDKLSWIFPDAFPKKPWKIEGQLAPNFSEASFNFIKGSSAPITTVGIGGKTVFDTPIGLTAYYAGSGKQCGKTVWSDFMYFGWSSSLYDKIPNISEYSLQMSKFGGGKRINVYPTYKLFGIELLGFPRTSYTLPAKLESDPPELAFDAKGGKENLTVTDNLDRDEDTYKDEVGVTYKEDDKEEWLTVKKTKGAYEVTAKPNTTAKERTASINFITYNEDRSIDLALAVPVMQKMPEYEFSLEPEQLPLPGYSKDFKDGELVQTVTVKYPVIAKSIELRSSDESWIRIDKNWTTSTADDFNYTATRKIYIKANTSLVDPRDAKIIAELTNADGTTDTKICEVIQEPMKLEVKLVPDKISLMAVATSDGKYSDTQKVNVEITPYDDIVASVIKDEYLEEIEVPWIDAKLENHVITVRGEANPVNEARKNYVTYVLIPTTGDPITRTLTVNQEALQETSICDDIIPKQIVLPAEGGEIDVTFNCDNIDHIKELTTFITGWLEGGSIGSKSIRLFAPNPNTGERKSGRFFVVFVMKDGTEQKQYYTAYQEGKMNIKKIYFKTFNMMHSDIVRYNQDEPNNFWNWLLMDAEAESLEMDLLVTKDNFTINSSIDGNTLHVECVGSGQSFGMTQEANLSFDVVNYNATEPDKAMVKNVKYSNNASITDGEQTGTINMGVNVDNIPVWNLSPLYIAASGTVAGGVKFSNFYDVISLPDGKATGYYDNDIGNNALLRISFEGNDDDDWSDVIKDDDDDDDWGDDGYNDDWGNWGDLTRSTVKKAKRQKGSNVLERRVLEQLRKAGKLK